MMARIAAWLTDTTQAITTGGSSNAYTATTSQSPATLPDGFTVYLLPNHDNTGAATLNVDSLGAKDLRITSGTALEAGAITTNAPFLARYRSASDEFLIDNGVDVLAAIGRGICCRYWHKLA